jgi:hypothetical protein
MKKRVLAGLAAVLLSITLKGNEPVTEKEGGDQSGRVFAGVNLTVSEGKKLIAEGIAHHPAIRQKMTSGMIIIARGTTNTYIAERLMGLDAPHGSFMAGNITPASRGEIDSNLSKIPEIILVNGKPAEMSLEEALKQLKKDDIVFKGANLLNYEKGEAAVCIGAPDGGTTARIRPFIGQDKARLIIPVGLEKEVWGDLHVYEQMLGLDAQRINGIPRVWVHHNGELFTEIEALKVFGNVEAIPYASGGIAGREGGISLAVYGLPAEVEKVLDVVKKIQGTEPFIP